MSEPTRLLLVRHGQSVWNADGRWQGHADVPLSELGRAQARAAAAAIGAVDVIVASDLARARETAEILAGELGVGPVRLDPRLRERGAGEWTGLTRAEIEAHWPGFLDAQRRPPAFEAEDVFAARALGALEDLVAAHPGADVLAVTHGGVLRVLERRLGEPGPTPFANLGGLVVEAAGGQLTVGPRRQLLDPDGVPVTRPPAT